MVKAILAPKVRNIFDWPRFLALETFIFLAQIYFLDLAIFWPLVFWLLQLFDIKSFLSQFFI